jgi:hypothetical protein
VIRALRPGQPTEREQPVSWGTEECVGGRRGRTGGERKGGVAGWLRVGRKLCWREVRWLLKLN